MPTTERKRADQKVETLEGELRAALIRKERATQDVNRAWGGFETAFAALDRANESIRVIFEDLCRARDERIALVPEQREAAD